MNRRNKESFVNWLKTSASTESIEVLKTEYNKMISQTVYDGITAILTYIHEIYIQEEELKETAEKKVIQEIKEVLADIMHAILNERENDDEVPYYFSSLVKKYATHYIPFNQATDPFKGTDFKGYCWGHTHRYGEYVSAQTLDRLSVVSDAKLYTTTKKNWTFADVFFRRVGWYFVRSLFSQKAKIRNTVWDVINQLDDNSIFNFNFYITGFGFHSTSLRVVEGGIEYYENNYGLVRFKNREKAAHFLTKHLLEGAKQAEGEVKLITVYKLPYSNVPTHEVLTQLPQSQMTKLPQAQAAPIVHPDSLQKAIQQLTLYGQKLHKENHFKAKIKASELGSLVQEFNSLPSDKIKQRVQGILLDKNHSLMMNRGSGLYFFKTLGQSWSTTESLLQEVANSIK